jgi:hypothetical protein
MSNETKVLIMVPHYWGKAGTIREAWQQVKLESGANLRDLKRGPWVIYAITDTDTVKARVDEMGLLCYHEDYPPTVIDAGRMRRK